MTDLNLEELILYRKFENGQILQDMNWVLGHVEQEEKRNEVRKRFFSAMHALTDLAGTYGFEGNLWHNYLTLLLVNHENVFSTSCEIRGLTDGSILTFAKHDFTIFMQLFSLDFSRLEEKLNVSFFEEILHYRRGDVEGRVFNRCIRDRICELSAQLAGDSFMEPDSNESGSSGLNLVCPNSRVSGLDKGGRAGLNSDEWKSNGSDYAGSNPDGLNFDGLPSGGLERFTAHMIRFYQEFGVGKFGLHKAFRIAHDDGGVQILPITNIAHVKLDDLVGYEIQKKKLIDNTEAFVQGKTANNCLLFGDAGTGKSSSIKGILNQYYDRGLRMIEIYKHQFKDLNAVIEQIKNRNYKFIIYMDDLSFEEFEIEYKYLKAVIEGGLERKPENVLIYATSNRRHLIREQYGDNMEGDIGKPAEIHATHGGDLHVSDTVQEKLSLSSRFGVTIYFGSPDKKQFQNIVRILAARYGITMPEEELLLEANKWELAHGGLSGRTAQQFVDYISAMQ
ncbi:MAG: ATP-binding protein [Lachnospiraceae bacterium]|nr:ATP-binding protein [Lachnospiraceae bacterium]